MLELINHDHDLAVLADLRLFAQLIQSFSRVPTLRKFTESSLQRFQQPCLRFLRCRLDVDMSNSRIQPREQSGFDQRRFSASGRTVQQADSEGAVCVTFFDPFLSEANECRESIAVAWSRQELQKEVVIVSVEGPQTARHNRCFRGLNERNAAGRQLWIYETMTAPVLKEGLIVGWDDRARSKFGREPDNYIRAVGEGGVSQQEFYEFCDAIILTTDTFENLPRVGFEAMASGSVLVVDNRGGWQLEVDDGVTGWLCRDDREFVYKASRCAFEAAERTRMQGAARHKLESEWGLAHAMDSWNRVFAAWSVLSTRPQS